MLKNNSANVQVIQEIHKNAISKKKELIVSLAGRSAEDCQEQVPRGRRKGTAAQTGTRVEVRKAQREGRRTD